MEIKKEHLNQKVFSKNLGSLVVLNNETKAIFIREGRKDLFKTKESAKEKPSKNDISAKRDNKSD